MKPCLLITLCVLVAFASARPEKRLGMPTEKQSFSKYEERAIMKKVLTLLTEKEKRDGTGMYGDSSDVIDETTLPQLEEVEDLFDCSGQDLYCSIDGVEQCLPWFKRNDQVVDCDNGRDETEPNCREDEYICMVLGAKTCMHDSTKCNGYIDCDEASEERNCGEPTCKQDDYICPFYGSRVCFHPKTQCDGNVTCDDAYDEKNCGDIDCMELYGHESFNSYTQKCNDTLHTWDGQSVEYQLCISPLQFCDGHLHCSDGTDEVGCSSSSSSMTASSEEEEEEKEEDKEKKGATKTMKRLIEILQNINNDD